MAKISANQLASYVVDQLEAGVSQVEIARLLASYLLENRQSRDLSKIVRAIEAEANRRGSTQVTVTSAHAVTEEVKTELATLLGAENPVFHEVIDANVIGGVKASAGEAEIDLTVRGKLNRFKTSIANSK
jgi:F0F1-type ATP synthase delta subunit